MRHPYAFRAPPRLGQGVRRRSAVQRGQVYPGKEPLVRRVSMDVPSTWRFRWFPIWRLLADWTVWFVRITGCFHGADVGIERRRRSSAPSSLSGTAKVACQFPVPPTRIISLPLPPHVFLSSSRDLSCILLSCFFFFLVDLPFESVSCIPPFLSLS